MEHQRAKGERVQWSILDPNDVIVAGLGAEYRQRRRVVHDQLVILNTDTFTLTKITQFPWPIFIQQQAMDYWVDVVQKFFAYTLRRIATCGTTQHGTLASVSRFADWVQAHVRPAYQLPLHYAIQEAVAFVRTEQQSLATTRTSWTMPAPDLFDETFHYVVGIPLQRFQLTLAALNRIYDVLAFDAGSVLHDIPADTVSNPTHRVTTAPTSSSSWMSSPCRVTYCICPNATTRCRGSACATPVGSHGNLRRRPLPLARRARYTGAAQRVPAACGARRAPPEGLPPSFGELHPQEPIVRDDRHWGAALNRRRTMEHDPPATPRMGTAIPAALTIPDRVETRLGTLAFFDGVPDDATVARVYDHLDFQRAVQAFLTAMPAASQHAQRHALRAFGPDNRTVAVFETLLDARTLLLTGNTESVYALAWLDLTDGPVVVESPPNTLGLVDDFWFHYVTDLGNAGPDRGQGGTYLFLPPDYQGDVPPGYHVFPSPTFGNIFGTRGFLMDGDPAPAVADFTARLRIYPLAQAATIHGHDVRERVRAGVQHDPRDGRRLLRGSERRRAGGAGRGDRPGDAGPAGGDRHRQGQAVRARRADAAPPH